MRKDTYTGGEHYFILFKEGTHAVIRETPDFEPENEVVFTGKYEKCSEYIDNLVVDNFEYDMNI